MKPIQLADLELIGPEFPEYLLAKPQWLTAATMYSAGTSVQDIAEYFEVSIPSIYRWLSSPDVKELVERVRVSVNAATRDVEIASKIRRILIAQREVDSLRELKASRAAAAGVVPGDETGLVAVKTITTVHTANNGSQTVTTTVEGKYEAAMHEQLRRLLEYVAKEKGELESSLSVKHNGRVDHVHREAPDMSNFTEEELLALAAIGEKHGVEFD